MESPYEADVQEAADCLANGEESDWRLAELTCKNTLRTGEVEALTGKRSMERWCADVQQRSSVRVRFGAATGYRYAKIWTTYGGARNGTDGSAPAVSFKDAYAEVDGTPDRDRMMAYEANRLLEQGTPEQKTSAAVALMQDPVVVERIAQAALEPESEPAQAVEGLNDRIVEERIEHALSEPTVSVADVDHGIRQARDESAPYQYDRLKQTLSAFFARYPADHVAAAIVASPHTDRIDLYVEGADQVVAWFQEFRRTLVEEARPHLIGVVESAG